MKYLRTAILSLFFLSLSQISFAATIQSVEVQGNQQASKDTILSNIESKPGTAYAEDKIKRDLKTLYKLGLFEDIQIERVNAGGGVKIIFVVKERSRVGKITFLGNKKIKKDKLEEMIGFKAYNNIDSNKLANAVKTIQEHYAKEGYQLADIRPEYKKMEGGSDSELIFNIREGEPIRIKRVNFIGNKVYSDRDLSKVIRSRERGYLSWLNGQGKYDEEALKRDVALLVYHYQNNGYLKAKASAPQVYLTRDKRWVNLTFHVEEGEKYKVGNVNVEGDILTTKEEFLSKFKLKKGDGYVRKNVEEDLMYLSQQYGDQGYAFANINPVIQPHDDDKTADVTYAIQKGPKVYIEKININGNTSTRDKVVRREILIKEDTLYNETRLKASKQKIEALGYFEEVNFATPRGSADDRVIINITLKEKATGSFSIGAGFSSVESFIFTASVSKDNFFGYGISGQLSTELSSKRQLFILSFEDPYFLDSNWILGVSGFRTVNVFTDFDRKSFGGSATLGHRLFDYSTVRLGYQVEDVTVGSFRTNVPAVFNQNLSGLTSSVSLSLQRDTRNNRLFPTKGMYNSASVEVAGVGGDNKFFRTIENFRYYQPIWKGFVGKVNFTASQISSLDSLPVPLFERFFLGGVNSLRGFDLRSIGPAVQIPNSPQGGDNRFVFGGNKMMQLNAELEFPLYEPAGFKGVAFFDAGNAFSEEQNFGLGGIRSNYGFGLRWNSPLGPLRFEWGLPIDKKPGEAGVIFNFTIGSFF